MGEQDVILAATEALAFLVSEKGFGGPDRRDESHRTALQYTAGNIGIEAELDWHERSAFLLLVRLSHGIWPKGYYVENGKTCRVHLQGVVRRFSWPTNHAFGPAARIGSDERMITQMTANATVLREVLDRVVAKGVELFEQTPQNRFQ